MKGVSQTVEMHQTRFNEKEQTAKGRYLLKLFILGSHNLNIGSKYRMQEKLLLSVNRRTLVVPLIAHTMKFYPKGKFQTMSFNIEFFPTYIVF